MEVDLQKSMFQFTEDIIKQGEISEKKYFNKLLSIMNGYILVGMREAMPPVSYYSIFLW